MIYEELLGVGYVSMFQTKCRRSMRLMRGKVYESHRKNKSEAIGSDFHQTIKL
jgi:hypothetical protein